MIRPRPMITPRLVDLAVLSDVHLGGPGCRAEDLVTYLKSIQPGKLVLCGDFVDIDRLGDGHWDEHHTRVVRRILKLVSNGVPVFWLAGNHEHALTRFFPNGLDLGTLHLVEELEWSLDGRRTLFIHGDAGHRDASGWFPARWLRSRRQRDDDDGKSGIRRIDGDEDLDFIECCARQALRRGCDTVVCGHNHSPEMRTVRVDGGQVAYLNAGDWVQHGTALEYTRQSWSLVNYDQMAEDADLLAGWADETRRLMPSA